MNNHIDQTLTLYLLFMACFVSVRTYKAILKNMEETLLLAFLCFAVCVCDRAEGIKLPGNETVPALIIFGDSIVDTGSSNDLGTPARCNFPLYGRDFEGGRPTGRFSNGRVPSDFLGMSILFRISSYCFKYVISFSIQRMFFF